jgi:hypothetical protein
MVLFLGRIKVDKEYLYCSLCQEEGGTNVQKPVVKVFNRKKEL